MNILLNMTVVGYEIEQLEQIIEEEAPLAPGPAGNYFGLTMIGLLILVVGALVASYMFTCMKYKKKIKDKHRYGIINMNMNMNVNLNNISIKLVFRY